MGSTVERAPSSEAKLLEFTREGFTRYSQVHRYLVHKISRQLVNHPLWAAKCVARIGPGARCSAWGRGLAAGSSTRRWRGVRTRRVESGRSVTRERFMGKQTGRVIGLECLERRLSRAIEQWARIRTRWPDVMRGSAVSDFDGGRGCWERRDICVVVNMPVHTYKCPNPRQRSGIVRTPQAFWSSHYEVCCWVLTP